MQKPVPVVIAVKAVAAKNDPGRVGFGKPGIAKVIGPVGIYDEAMPRSSGHQKLVGPQGRITVDSKDHMLCCSAQSFNFSSTLSADWPNWVIV